LIQSLDEATQVDEKTVFDDPPSNPSTHVPSKHIPSTHVPSAHIPSAHIPSNHVKSDLDTVALPNSFGGVTSDAPHTGENIRASTMFGTPRQFTTAHLKDFTNPLLKNHNPAIGLANPAVKKMKYDSAAHKDEGIKFKSGGYEINIQHNHAKNFLDASRVQVGTSFLGAHDDKDGKVARFRVYFMNPFKKRPIVFITTVPEGAERETDISPHPVSISEIGHNFFSSICSHFCIFIFFSGCICRFCFGDSFGPFYCQRYSC
jgi:hypothetical protein